MQFIKSLNIDIMATPSVKKARQPNFIPSGTDTRLYFRRGRVYIMVHKEKLPNTFIFNRPNLILGFEVKVNIFTEVLRFLYEKKIYANPGNYRELLRIATDYSINCVERELLFNMDHYLTYSDLQRFDDPRLTALFKKKLLLSCTEAVRYLNVQTQRKLDQMRRYKREYLAVYATPFRFSGNVINYTPYSAPRLPYYPPESIISLAIIDSDDMFYHDLYITRISFSIQDIYGFAKAKVYYFDDNRVRTPQTFECKLQGITLIPFGQTMAVNFTDLYISRTSFRFVIELEGSIFVDKNPGRAKINLTMKDEHGPKYEFFSFPLRSAFPIKFKDIRKYYY